MENKKSVVLIAEDTEGIQKFFENIFGERTKLLMSGTIEGTRRLFLANMGNIDLIVMDGELTDGDTIELVSEIRKSYAGDIIAASGKEKVQERLMAAGCNISCPKPSSEILGEIEKVIAKMT